MRLFFMCICIICFSLFLVQPASGQSLETKDSISARNAIVIEQESSRIVFEKDAHEKRPIASITKIMTAMIAIENGDGEDMVTTSERAVSVGGSSIYLEKNEKMTLEDLLYGLMLRSGNDAAIAISEHIGGSVEGFVFLMNEKAQEIGMLNTNFTNPHGLDEDEHYSTAYDMAILMRYAMENELFQSISGTKVYQSKHRDYRWFNKNKLLTNMYSNCTGGKTGFTKKAGRTLVTTATKESLSFIIVTLDAGSDWNDHIYLYEKMFDEMDLVLLDRRGKQTFVMDDMMITGHIEKDVVFPLREEEKFEVTKKVILTDIHSNDRIGKVVYLLQDEKLIEIPIYSEQGTKVNFLSHVKRVIQHFFRMDEDG